MITINENRRLWEVDHKVEVIDGLIKVYMNNECDWFRLPTADGEYLLDDSMLLLYNPIQSIIKTGEDIVINVFYDDPYERGIVPDFKRQGSVISAKPSIDNNLDMAKYFQLSVIKTGFENEFVSGHFLSATLGIEVDCRRVGIKNDIQNVDGLILNYPNLTEPEKYYVGYTEITTFPLTFDQLNSLKLEMVQWGKNQYGKKWALSDSISKATTIEEVKSLIW